MPNDYISQLQTLASQNFLGSLVQEASAKAIAMKSDQVQQVIKGVNQERKLLNDGELETTQQQIEGVTKDSSVAPELQSIEQSAANYQKLQLQVAKQQEDVNRVYGKAALALGGIGTAEALNVGGVLDKQRVEELRVLANKGEIPERVAKYAELQLSHSMNIAQYQDYITARNSKKELEQVEDFIVSNKAFQDMSPYGRDVYSGTREGEKAMRDFDASAKALTAAVKAQFPNLSAGVLGGAINATLTTHGKNLTVKQVDPIHMQELLLKREELGTKKYGEMLAAYNQQSSDLSALQSWSKEWNNTAPELRDAIKYYRSHKTIPVGTEYKEETLKEELKRLESIQVIMDRTKFTVPGFNVGSNYGKTEYKGRLMDAPVILDSKGNVIKDEKGVPKINPNDPYGAIIRFQNIDKLLNDKFEYNPYEFLKRDETQTSLSKKVGEERGWFQDIIEAAQGGSQDRFGTQGSERKPEPPDPNKLLHQDEVKAAESIIRSRRDKSINLGK